MNLASIDGLDYLTDEDKIDIALEEGDIFRGVFFDNYSTGIGESRSFINQMSISPKAVFTGKVKDGKREYRQTTSGKKFKPYKITWPKGTVEYMKEVAHRQYLKKKEEDEKMFPEILPNNEWLLDIAKRLRDCKPVKGFERRALYKFWNLTLHGDDLNKILHLVMIYGDRANELLNKARERVWFTDKSTNIVYKAPRGFKSQLDVDTVGKSCAAIISLYNSFVDVMTPYYCRGAIWENFTAFRNVMHIFYVRGLRVYRKACVEKFTFDEKPKIPIWADDDFPYDRMTMELTINDIDD